jgi:hypothetical protein
VVSERPRTLPGMPSAEHEGLVTLFERQPSLAVKLLELTGAARPPEFTEARVESSNLSQLDPASFHADAVVVLRNRKGKAVLALVVEVQRQVDANKRFSWMVYVASVAARFRCPADLLVVTLDSKVSRWARRPLIAVRRMPWSPVVVGPEEIPRVIDVEEAKRSPEWALLSLMAHATSDDLLQVVKLGYATVHALEVLEPELQDLYSRMVDRILRTEVARELEAYMNSQGEDLGYFSRKALAAAEQARREGRQEGRREGRQEQLLRLLELRFGALSPTQRQHVEAADPAECERLFALAATRSSLKEVLG